MNRSLFIGGLCTATAVAAAAAAARAQSGPRPARVDVHHHCLPSSFDAAAAPLGALPALEGWTPERSFADMDAAGVTKAILSLPRSPIVYTGSGEQSRIYARQFNEFMADVKRRYPQRLSFWAEVPLPDAQGAVAEAAYALDHLGADGIAVCTSYGKSWLGDPAFAPLWEMLDQRKAIVFTHPLANQCCVAQLRGIADTTIEYGTDTTRTIASLVFSGTTLRYPGVRFIFAHAGGTMPFLIDRFRFQARDPKIAAILTAGVDIELRKLYFETAQAADPEAIGALMQLVPASQIMFGSDYPYRRAAENVDGLAHCGLRATDLDAIYSRNVTALLAHA